MFCPKCGNADQKRNTYCRQCGTYLPDFDKLTKKEVSPEQQITISSTFNFLSALISLVLTVLLHIFFTGKEGTPILIYVVIGFLTANFFWQVQAFWRIRQLIKQFPNRKNKNEKIDRQSDQTLQNSSFATEKLLPEPDLSNVIKESFVKNTAKNLKTKIKLS